MAGVSDLGPVGGEGFRLFAVWTHVARESDTIQGIRNTTTYNEF